MHRGRWHRGTRRPAPELLIRGIARIERITRILRNAIRPPVRLRTVRFFWFFAELRGTGSRLTDRIRAGVRWGAQRAHAEPRRTRRNSNCFVGGSAPQLAPGVLFLHGGPVRPRRIVSGRRRRGRRAPRSPRLRVSPLFSATLHPKFAPREIPSHSRNSAMNLCFVNSPARQSLSREAVHKTSPPCLIVTYAEARLVEIRVIRSLRAFPRISSDGASRRVPQCQPPRAPALRTASTAPA